MHILLHSQNRLKNIRAKFTEFLQLISQRGSAFLVIVRNHAERFSLAVLAFMVVGAFAIRLYVLETQSNLPGEDLAGDLLVLRSYLGNSPRPYFQNSAPPLYYFLVLFPIASAIGPVAGVKVAVSLVASLIALPFYSVLRKFSRHQLAVLASTALFMFSQPYNEMLGWGGSINLLGIFFLLWCLALLLDSLASSTFNKKSVVLSGIFFSLTAGTHPLTAVYLLVAFALMIGFSAFGARRAHTLRTLLSIAALGLLLSIVYVPSYWYLATNRTNIGTPSDLALIATSWYWMPFSIVRNLWLLVPFLLLSLGSFLYVVRWRAGKELKLVLLAFAVGSFLISLPMNPATIDRAFYYVPIPWFIAIGILLDRLCSQPSVIQQESTRLTRAPRVAKLRLLHRGPIGAGIALLVAGIFISASYGHLVVAVDYYGLVDSWGAKALDWIAENTPRDAVFFVEYEGFGTWMEALSGRKAFQPRPSLYIVTAPDLVDNTAANLLSLGNHVLENSAIAVGDLVPGGVYNPMVFVRSRGYYLPALFLSDDYQSFAISFAGLETRLVSAPEKVVTRGWASSADAGFTVFYRWPFGNVTKTVVLDVGSRLEVTYDIDVGQSDLITTEYFFAVPVADSVHSARLLANGIQIEVDTSSGDTIVIEVSIESSSSPQRSLTFAEKDELIGLPAARFSFEINAPRSNVTFSISLVLRGTQTWQSPQYYSVFDIMVRYNITHVVVSQSNYVQLVRFRAMPGNFVPVYENPSTLVLERTQNRG